MMRQLKTAGGVATLVSVAVIALTVLPMAASAAVYSVWNCANASGQPLDAGDWTGETLQGGGVNVARSTCSADTAGPGALIAEANTGPFQSGQRYFAAARFKVAAPSSTLIRRADLWWANVATSPARIEVSSDFANPFYRRIGGGFGVFAAGRPSVAYSAANHQAFSGLAGPNLFVNASCGSYCPWAGARAARFAIYRTRLLVDDVSAPRGGAIGLRQHARVGTATPLIAGATDAGGGVREITLRVDNQVVKRIAAGGTCNDVDETNGDPYEYARMRPCPGRLAGTLTLNPSQLSGDPQQAAIVATDAEGTSTLIARATVARAAPQGFHDAQGFVNPDLNIAVPRVANGVGAGPSRAQLGLIGKRGLKGRATVMSTGRARVRARLATPTGVPIVGARVWIATAVRAGAWQVTGPPLTTSKTGQVSTRLPAGKPSRFVQLVYFPYSNSSSQHTLSPAARLSVRSRSTIHVDQRLFITGQTAHFRGTITTRPVAARHLVILQALVRGKWSPFRTVRSNSKGRWRINYRFEATRRPSRYKFRAVVPHQKGDFYASGRSKMISTIVTP